MRILSPILRMCRLLCDLWWNIGCRILTFRFGRLTIESPRGLSLSRLSRRIGLVIIRKRLLLLLRGVIVLVRVV